MTGSLKNLPLVSVIIPNYNGEKVIKDCLKSVYSSDYPDFEVILVDDASKDHSTSLIQSLFPVTKIIRNSRNIGFARTVNRGIKESSGEIFVLLNMDAVVRRDWLSELVRSLTSDEKIGIVGSKILDHDERTIQHAGGLIGRNGISFHIGRGEIDVGQYDKLSEVDTKGVEITSQVTGLENVTREDKAAPSLTQEEAISGTKKTKNGMFEVNAILEE